MIYKSDTIQEFYDGYSIEEISCLERAFYAVMSGYEQFDRNLFLLISKHMECYIDEDYEKKTILNEKIDLIKRYWNLNLGLNKFNEEEMLRALESGKQVVVLINLYKLYYSSHYNKNNVLHPIVVTGYDDKDGLYNILYNTFEPKEYKGIYSFTMRRDDLISCALSYEKEFSSWSDGKGLIVFSGAENIKSSIDVWQQWFKEYCNRNFKNRELIYLKELKEETHNERVKMILNRLMNIEKAKKVFVNEFLNLCNAFYHIHENNVDIIQLVEKICEQWRKYINRSVRQVLAARFKKVNLDEFEIQELENKLHSELVELVDKNYIIETVDDKIVFENNDDKIITAVDNDKYIFEFNNKRLYNTWRVDESPKLFTKKFKFENLDAFTYQIRLKRLEDENANYFSGIVLKLDQDVMFFGYDSSKGINIDIANKEFSIINMPSENKVFNLKIYVTTNFIEFIYDDKSLHKMNISNNNIGRVGIGCKTYNQPSYLKLEIDIK